jgi:excisionase family DNA binding protein
MLLSFVNDQLSLDLTTDSGSAESGQRRVANAAAAKPVGLERLLTAREVGQRLGLSTATVLDWFEAGRLPGFRLGGRVGGPVRFDEVDVARLLASWRVGPAPAGQPSA